MRTRIGRLVALLILGMILTPTGARGQDLYPPEVLLPIPLGPEDGQGIFLAAEFLFMRQTNPLEDQPVAFRGFVDVDGSITGTAGNFVGSRTPALDVNQVGGPVTWQPGLALAAGWRFSDGTLIEASWWHLSDARYSATASLIPYDFQVRADLADSFISSPVFNFPIDYAGPALQVAGGNPGSTFGIWNASSLQTIDFVQRFDQGMLIIRIPFDRT